MSPWDIFRWRTLAGGPPCRQRRQRFPHRAPLSPRPKACTALWYKRRRGTRLGARQSPLDDGWSKTTPTENHKQYAENGSRRARFLFLRAAHFSATRSTSMGPGLRLCLAHLQGLQKALRPPAALGLALGIQPGDGLALLHPVALIFQQDDARPKVDKAFLGLPAGAQLHRRQAAALGVQAGDVPPSGARRFPHRPGKW